MSLLASRQIAASGCDLSAPSWRSRKSQLRGASSGICYKTAPHPFFSFFFFFKKIFFLSFFLLESKNICFEQHLSERCGSSPGCAVPKALLPSSGHLPPALREGVPGHSPSETKGEGKKANRQLLEDFPQHDPRIKKKAKQILHIKATTL